MHILILGAGYAGLRVATELEQLLGATSPTTTITLVDQNPYHQLIQILHLTATGGNGHTAAIDLDSILDGRRISFVRGQVTQIKPLERQAILADGRALAYDRLVLALGGETNYGNVPGAYEHSVSLRSYSDAVKLREQLVANYTAAAQATDPTERRILMTTAIVGAGYTGCQLAGELADWADELCRATGAPRSEVRIALLDRAPRLLGQFGTWADHDAQRVLDSKGVSIYLNTGIERVEPRLLHVSENRLLRAATIVWAGGFRAPALLANSGLPTDPQGRVIVDRYLRVQDQALIFAIGDCARVIDPVSGELVPATASYALRQGEHLAESLLAEIDGRAPSMYEPLKLGEVVSLGSDYAIGNPLGVPVTGMPALLLKKGIESWYRSLLAN